MTVHIVQHGKDGFGHQILGMFTCLILHNIHDYYFDGVAYIEKEFQFEHLDEEQAKLAKEYLLNIIQLFVHQHAQKKQIYTNV